MPSQRPFFLSTFFAAFRQQSPATSTSLPSTSSQPQPPNKQPAGPVATAATAAAAAAAASGSRTITSSATASASSSSNPQPIPGTAAATAATGTSPSPSRSGATTTSGVIGQLPIHSPRSHHHHHHAHHHHSPHGIPIPQPGRYSSKRRGSDSSSEGFRDVPGTEKLYVGGQMATGEERFFPLGVVRRIRSGDRLSLDRLSL